MQVTATFMNSLILFNTNHNSTNQAFSRKSEFSPSDMASSCLQLFFLYPIGALSIVLNAGDCYFIACCRMFISWNRCFICKRLEFLQGSNASPLQQIPALCSLGFCHLVPCCHIFSCYVLDLSLCLNNSLSLSLFLHCPLFQTLLV